VLTRGQLETTVFLVPLYMAPLVLLTAGVAWFLAALGVYFRDLGQIVAVIVSALLFLTPVFYPTSAVPESYRFLLELNPLTFYAEAMRSLVLEGELPSSVSAGWSAITAVAVFLLGFAFFSRARQGFADVL
jgi:lipopolysaccharide transport system permease protein